MLYIFLSSLCGCAGSVLTKFYAKKAADDIISKIIYLLITALAAILINAALAGFNLPINGRTLIYCAIDALIVAVNMTCQLVLYRRVNIILFNLIAGCASLIIPSLFGFIFLNEAFTWQWAVAGSLTLISVILPMLKFKPDNADIDDNKSEAESKKLAKHELVLVIIALTVLTCVLGAGSILSKLFAEDLNKGLVTSAYSYNCFTNIFLTGLLIIVVVPFGSIKPQQFKASIKNYKLLLLLFIVLITAMSNISALLSIEINRTMDISLTTIIGKGFSQILITLSSVFIFKTKLDLITILALILSIGATLILCLC